MREGGRVGREREGGSERGREDQGGGGTGARDGGKLCFQVTLKGVSI